MSWKVKFTHKFLITHRERLGKAASTKGDKKLKLFLWFLKFLPFAILFPLILTAATRRRLEHSLSLVSTVTMIQRLNQANTQRSRGKN